MTKLFFQDLEIDILNLQFAYILQNVIFIPMYNLLFSKYFKGQIPFLRSAECLA
jgi:hypothetical protein